MSIITIGIDPAKNIFAVHGNVHWRPLGSASNCFSNGEHEQEQ